MTTLPTRDGVAVLRSGRGDVLLVSRRGATAATVLPDPGGVVANAVRVAAARDKLRKEKR